MSLMDEAKMPSLKDKIMAQAEKPAGPEAKKEVKSKGRKKKTK